MLRHVNMRHELLLRQLLNHPLQRHCAFSALLPAVRYLAFLLLPLLRNDLRTQQEVFAALSF